jgi:hypothetical protein
VSSWLRKPLASLRRSKLRVWLTRQRPSASLKRNPHASAAEEAARQQNSQQNWNNYGGSSNNTGGVRTTRVAAGRRPTTEILTLVAEALPVNASPGGGGPRQTSGR